jgi:hypothetical protein
MSSNNRNRRWAGGVGMAVGAAFAALVGAGVAHADDDISISFDGYELIPTLGNSAFADTTPGTFDLAIAVGAGTQAIAEEGFGNFAFSLGNSTFGTGGDAFAGGNAASLFDSAYSISTATSTGGLAVADGGTLDTAVAIGQPTTAVAGEPLNDLSASGNSFDTAVADQPLGEIPPSDIADADTGSFESVFSPPLAAAADPAATDTGPFQLLFGDAGINTWTPEADALLLADDPSLDATLTTSVEDFWTAYGSWGADDPITVFIAEQVADSFDKTPGLPVTGIGDLAVSLDYGIYASGLAPTLDPDLWQFFDTTLPSVEGDALFALFFPEDLLLLGLLPFIAVAG